MVLPLILGIFLLIALYFIFWYITIPATIIIIVIIWLRSRNNKKNSTDHSERTYYKQATAGSNNQYYQQDKYEDPYAEDGFYDRLDDSIFENYNNTSKIDKDKLVKSRLEKFDFSEEEAELVFGKKWRDKLGQEHYQLFSDIISMRMNLLTPPEWIKIGLSFYQESIREKVSHIIDKVIRMIESVYNEDPEYAKNWEELCEKDAKDSYFFLKEEWEFFKKYKKSRFEYSENTFDKSEAYEILGLAVTATIQQVKKKYRELALKWHPDRNMTNKTQAEEMFVKINLAYETIMAAA